MTQLFDRRPKTIADFGFQPGETQKYCLHCRSSKSMGPKSRRCAECAQEAAD